MNKEAMLTGTDEAVSQSLLAFCKASADQQRLDILSVLSRDSFGVLELVQIFDSKQSGISHHLKILADAGLVVRRREGNSIFYRRAHTFGSGALAELQKELFRAVDHQPLYPEVKKRLLLIQKERAEKAEGFFRENSDKFRQQQEQIAAYELYGPNARDLIASSFMADAMAGDTVLEIGPGEGEFLAELSPQFRHVIGLDNSTELLQKAQAFVARRGLGNVELIHGDTKHELLKQRKIDCVVMNMVLHHVPSPMEMLFDIAELLEQGGQLFITELCAHDQSWVTDSCGDLWLGFEPDDLGDWAQNAGFKVGESVYLAQRNGFRVQIRQFVK